MQYLLNLKDKMAKTTKKFSTFYQKYSRVLQKEILKRSESFVQTDLFGSLSKSVYANVSGVTKHSLRPYQFEALSVLDYLYAESMRELISESTMPGHKLKEIIADLTEKIGENEIKKVPFFGFEMATGSGKTMLMGASVYLLNKKYGVKNFLIITPASTDIYNKTIRNFTTGTFDTIWSEDPGFSFNLITGDTYKNTSDLYFDPNKDANIFIFNISKFGSNAKHSEMQWEESGWKDNNGNTISIKEFLRRERLVVITDEAHHAQSKASNQIIKKFEPEAVLEFTATALESSRGDDKRKQKVVYKYDIRRFLEDGHGKLIKAVALNLPEKDSNKDTISESEKIKLITLLLIHMVKKEAVLHDRSIRGLKPIAFIKVKDDSVYTKKVFEYIRNELYLETDLIKLVIEKMRSQDLEITGLIIDLINRNFENNLEKISKELKRLTERSLLYLGTSSKDEEKKFENIRKNEIEIVVYIKRLDEGIDMPNIYSMAVINDNVSEFKTSIKQIIGRGVRLAKNVREFDSEESYLAQSEKLHIVCDMGKSFEDVIKDIQQEFGLNDKYLSYDKEKAKITDKVKSHLLEGKTIPKIEAEFKVRDGIKLIDLVGNVENVIQSYIEHNTFKNPEDKYFLKYNPESFFVEVDVFADENIYHQQIQQAGGRPFKLNLTASHAKKIYGIVQRNLFCLPDTEFIYDFFLKYINKLNETGLFSYKITDIDEELAYNQLIQSFSFFYRSHIEKAYYTLVFKNNSDEDWILKNEFKNKELFISADQVESKKFKNESNIEKVRNLIDENVFFYGYKNHIYDYVTFDSYTEKHIADYIDEVTEKDLGNKPFWIRNERNLYFKYGSRKYYPDFILFFKGTIYIIETKGDLYSDTHKNLLLQELDKYEGYKSLLVFSSQMDKLKTDELDFSVFIELVDNYIEKKNVKENLIKDPNPYEKYVKLLPVYSPEGAFRKYSQQKDQKELGWIDCSGFEVNETMFVVQIGNNSLLSGIENNELCIFHRPLEVREQRSSGKALLYLKSLNKEYQGGVVLAEYEVRSRSTNQLIPTNYVVLKKEESHIEIEVNGSGGIELVGEFVGSIAK